MNRDQWILKMKREEQRLVQTGQAVEGSARKSIFDRRAGAGDRRATISDRRRSADIRPTLSPKRAAAARPVERFGACCEWGLPGKAQKR